jgi:hypothetical protein
VEALSLGCGPVIGATRRNEIGLQRVHASLVPGRKSVTSISQQTQYINPCRLRTNGVCTHMGQLSANSAQPFNSRSPISADTCSHRPSRGCSILLACRQQQQWPGDFKFLKCLSQEGMRPCHCQILSWPAWFSSSQESHGTR